MYADAATKGPMITEMLDAIMIRGFRSIASIEELELRPLNVLIGANGSGKSNFLEVFKFLREIREGRLQDYVAKQGGANNILHFGEELTSQLELGLTFAVDDDELKNTYYLALGPTADDRFYAVEEIAGLWHPPTHPGPYEERFLPGGGREAGISDPDLTKTAGWVRFRLGLWTTYHFHDTSANAPLRKTAHLNDNRSLRPDGANLAAFLYLLRERHPESYRSIRRLIQRITPFFDDFLLEPLALRPDSIRLEWRHKGSDKHFDVASLSDGTLRFIALATLLLQPKELRPRIILIDEPELGLHPAAITMLGSLVRMASNDSQVILSTQSSLFLDEFAPQDVLVAERVGMTTELRRLDPEPLQAWLEDYSLGQLWEKNELGGRP
jgi:predicted ATPase